ncbi:DUF262 domain-containing protein [Thermomonospora umbrina]|uniref:Uncharacterized protein DUF262 n=1 Tax=Thermomonospora umbrina TaxID=111806 RepID=A0A3D9SJ86_9ACTN|nr:DUF262 domain-containing protein [Thermomonospora umbrina]REE95767.1 uncharacterized protein DUF262 [Thermomonospora umbrina]
MDHAARRGGHFVAGRIGAIDVSGQEQFDVPVEYDYTGLSTGVEAEAKPQVEPIHRIQDPFDPAEIDVQTRSMTVGLLLARLRRGVLDLAPDFQRFMGVWDDTDQSKLIESLLLRIPLPTLYAAESGDDSWVIVDGIQRLSTIARFVDPEVFGVHPLRLHGLEYLHNYEGNTYSELPGRLQTRIDETELIVHLIRSGTPEPVMYNIFARINTGGRPLTTQELRHALIPGPVRGLLAELAYSAPFLEATLGSVKQARMADREMVLRFLAFRLTEPTNYPRGDLDLFLRQAMKRINTLAPKEIERLTDDFNRAMWAAHYIFEEYAFRKRFPGQERRLPINKALFEAVSVNLAKLTPEELTALREGRDMVRARFMALMENDSFLQSISIGTGDAEKVRRRFAMVNELFRGVAR